MTKDAEKQINDLIIKSKTAKARLLAAIAELDGVKDDLQGIYNSAAALKNELQELFDNMSEEAQSEDKGGALTECIEHLEEATDELDTLIYRMGIDVDPIEEVIEALGNARR